MGLKDVLSKMKIVEFAPDAAVDAAGSAMVEAPPGGVGGIGGVPERPVDVRDLLGNMPPPPPIDDKALEEASATVPDDSSAEMPDFAAVYKSAGIVDPPHGFTALKVLQILLSPDLANLDSRAKASALSGFLKMNPAGPVPIADIVQDAVRRDQALDRFEGFLRNKLKSRTEQLEHENARLQAEIDDLARRNREKMDANRHALESEEAKLGQWQVAKRAEERRLFDAVAPFVEANPVTTGDVSPSVPPPASPAGDPRA
jgi:hypothetical protein